MSYLRVMKLAQEFFLIHDRVDAALGYDSRLGHLLHGVEGLFFSELYSPHLAEAATPDHILKVKVVLVYFYEQKDWVSKLRMGRH